MVSIANEIRTVDGARRMCCLTLVMFTIVLAFCFARSAELIFVKFETVRSSTIEFGTTENNLSPRIYENQSATWHNFLVEMTGASLQGQKHLC